MEPKHTTGSAPRPDFDAIVIGGGPGGSAAATYLAKAGKKTLVLEKEVFPRFHVGESLLPYNRRIFEEMGVLGALEAEGFPRKYGAQFHLGNGLKALKLVFRNGRFTRESAAIQVERAKFDHLLLKHARGSGADVREGWTVSGFEHQPGCMKVNARDPEGKEHVFSGAFLLDASGRANLTGNQEQVRVIHPRHRKLAVFGHFEGVPIDSGQSSGDTIIVRLENKWFWLIPVSATKVSVGCVMEASEFTRQNRSPREVFDAICDASTEMRARMAGARLVSEIHVTSDFSYFNKRLVGPRLLRVGDAAGFMDPIFSAGVYLAMYSGKLAAGVAVDSLNSGHDGGALLKQYERRVSRGMRLYWKMVEAFYTQPFIELFLEPRKVLSLPDAVTALLAGELEGGWKLYWRRHYFHLLIWIQGRFPLVPRLTFAETPDSPVEKRPVSEI